MKDKPSSKKSNFKSIIGATIAISIIVLLVLSFVLALYFFSTLGIFHLLNIKFDSFLSIISFILLYFLIGIVSDIFIGALILLMNHSGKYTLRQQQVTSLVFSFLTNWAIVSFLDYVMHSIQIGLVATIILALIFSLIEYACEGLEKDGEKE
ncbi:MULTISPECIES: YrvL family regulatory protein [Cytobacillus]|uniref:YrvL family regulatory protein n=1 Tax=Cytobacillus TaxID=2675230 RepID=UPI0025A076E0|nr:YrvL family regulatory protein [Cytobacillus kochii]MDM5208964.1 YrvL family regulatory protein [Cytobacillus kochii]